MYCHLLGKLNDIKEECDTVFKRKVAVFETYKGMTVPSWEGIADAVEKLDNITLAQALRNKYVHSQSVQTTTGDYPIVSLPPYTHVTCTTTSAVSSIVSVVPTVPATTTSPTVTPPSDMIMSDTSPMSPQSTLPVVVTNEFMTSFSSISARFDKLVGEIKEAIQNQLTVTGFQHFLNENCRFQLIENASMVTVLDKMGDFYSLFEHGLLEDIVNAYFSETQLKPQLNKFEEEFQNFNKSTTLNDLVTDIEEKSNSNCLFGYSEIEMKLSKVWRKVTIDKFKKFIEAFSEDHNKRIHIHSLRVTCGCVCVTWYSRNIYFYQPIAYHLKSMGVMYIKVDGKTIYESNEPIDDSLDTALLNAIDDENYVTIELLLTIGANPCLPIPSTGCTALKVMTKMRDIHRCTVLHVACQYGHCDTVSMLLDGGSDPNTKDRYNCTVLVVASSNGHTKVVELLLSANANPDLRGRYNQTALMMASSNGHTKVVELLLSAGANPDLADNVQKTALMMASSNGHTKVVELLLSENANPDLRGRYNQTALMMASSNGHTKVVELLLSVLANTPDLRGRYNQTALMMASSNGNTKVVQLLLSANANPDLAGNHQKTALMMASSNGHTKVVELLLSANANPDLRDHSQETALMMASSNGYTELVELLLSANANPDLADNHQKTALMMASSNGHTKVVELLLSANATPNLRGNSHWQETALMMASTSSNGHIKVVELLLSANANPDLGDCYKRTALMMASSNGHTEVVELLLSANADPNKTDEYNKTALMMASFHGHTKVVELLLSAGADPTIQQTELCKGKTGLYLACEGRNVEITSILLKAGADPDLAKSNGWTPLFRACANGDIEIIELLLKHNANVDQAASNGYTPLIIACQYNNFEAIKVLLEWDADINAATVDGTTAFSIAHEKAGALADILHNAHTIQKHVHFSSLSSFDDCSSYSASEHNKTLPTDESLSTG